jgi:hypothetical protein
MGAMILSCLWKFKLLLLNGFSRKKDLLSTLEYQQFQQSAMQHAETI